MEPMLDPNMPVLQDSEMELRFQPGSASLYPPVPAEKPPTGFLTYSIKGQPWGSASIYDPDYKPPKKEAYRKKASEMPEKARGPRRTFISKSYIDQAPDDYDEDSDFDEFWCLPLFNAFMLATIIEDCIIEMRILIECNTALRVMKTLTDMNLLLALKYGVAQRKKLDDLDGIDPHRLNCSEYKLVKLDSDRNKVIDLFLSLYTELSTEKCYTALFDFISIVQEYEDNKAFVIEDQAKNSVLKKELGKKLRLQVLHINTVIYEADNLLELLKSQIEDATLMTETKGRYVDNWQSARTEQHALVLFEKESVYTNSSEYYKRRSDHESRVHAEVETFTNIVINETLKSVQEWMEKYEKDMEAIDLKIQIQKLDWQNMFDKRREMEKTYRKHSKMITEWIHFKDEREKAQLYSKTMTKSAIIVQAWWRGLLVRKKLGPYRVKKKRGGKK